MSSENEDEDLKIGDQCIYIKNGNLPDRVYEDGPNGKLFVYNTKLPREYFNKRCVILDKRSNKKIYELTERYKISFLGDGLIAMCESYQLSKAPTTKTEVDKKSKSDRELCDQIYNDTLNDKLKWRKVYLTHTRTFYYRSVLKLDGVKSAEMLFDGEVIQGYWGINVYYKRENNQPIYVRCLKDCKYIIDAVESKIAQNSEEPFQKQYTFEDWFQSEYGHGTDQDPDIETVNCTGSNITSLKGVENLKNLKVLNCFNNKITSLKELAGLKKLQKLFCFNNEIDSLSGIENLINLTDLYIGNNKIKNLDGLQNLVNLKDVSCYRNNLKNLGSLDQLKNLTRIYCKNNDMNDAYIDYYKEYFRDKGVDVVF